MKCYKKSWSNWGPKNRISSNPEKEKEKENEKKKKKKKKNEKMKNWVGWEVMRTMVSPLLWHMLMKVQHGAVSENSVDDSCVPFTVIWTWNFLHSLGKRDGICSMAWGYTSLVSTPSELWPLEMCQSQIILPRYGVIAWLSSCDVDM